MFVAALLDLGAGSVEFLEESLDGLGLDGWSIASEKTKASGLAATRFRVETAEEQQPRSFSGIRKLLAAARLPETVRSHSLAVFGRLAEAEARAHGQSLEAVHFHEVGMVDSIIDIVSSCLLVAELSPERVICSPVTLGSGTVDTRHGIMPVPSPATAILLAGVPVRQGSEHQELATPTGAALVSYFADSFGPLPDIRLDSAGYGAGTRETRGPNLLRMILGKPWSLAAADTGGEAGGDIDSQVLLETNIDDSTPEQLAYLAERLLDAGAADAWLTPVIMKKGRPAVTLSVLGRPGDADRLLDLIFRESSTFGVRARNLERHCLQRRELTVGTAYGEVRVKVGVWRGRQVSVSPEYEDCRRAAARHGVAISDVYDAARAAVR